MEGQKQVLAHKGVNYTDDTVTDENDSDSQKRPQQQKKKQHRKKQTISIHLMASAPKKSRGEENVHMRKEVTRLVRKNNQFRNQVKDLQKQLSIGNRKAAGGPMAVAGNGKAAQPPRCPKMDQKNDKRLNPHITSNKKAVHILFCKQQENKKTYMVKVTGVKSMVMAKYHELFAIFQSDRNVEDFGCFVPLKGAAAEGKKGFHSALAVAEGKAMNGMQKKRISGGDQNQYACMAWQITDQKAMEEVLQTEMAATHTFTKSEGWPWGETYGEETLMEEDNEHVFEDASPLMEEDNDDVFEDASPQPQVVPEAEAEVAKEEVAMEATVPDVNAKVVEDDVQVTQVTTTLTDMERE